MKFYFLLLVLICSCQKDPEPSPEPPARTIEGHWKILVPATPQWHYVFDDGLLEESVYVGPTKIVSYLYPYAIRADTIFVGGDINTPPTLWNFKFHLDSLVELKNITPGVMIAPVSLIIKTP